MITILQQELAKMVARHIGCKWSGECHFCGQEYSNDQDPSQIGVALEMVDKGWREVESRKYQSIALACPECAKAKDRHR